jgi:hypothetical protein
MIAKEVTLEDVRQALLASKNLDADVHQVLENCTVVVRCLQRGANVDVMHSGLPQVVVIIKVLGDFSFGAFLLAPEPAGLRLVWSLKAEKLKIYPSPQGDLVVESGIFRPDDSPCCPSGSRIEVYRWIDGRMRMISAKEQR